MKTAIFSDVHGNLEALQAIVADAKAKGVIQFACLGDVVGYGANPNECIELIRNLNCPIVKGNHDQAAGHPYHLDSFNWYAAVAIEWTQNRLTSENKNWLQELPMSQIVQSFTIVHACLESPSDWIYVLNQTAALWNFAKQTTAVCFNGHTHLPIAYVQVSPTHTKAGMFTKLKIESGNKYLINAGSTGQPRDRQPKASYVIFDSESETVLLQRTEYDIKLAQSKILESGMDLRAAERLSGRLEKGE